MGADRGRRRCAIAHDQWRTNVFAPPLCWDLETVEQFDEAARTSARRTSARRVLVSADLARHAAWLQELAALGVRRDLRSTTSARTRTRSSTRSASEVLPELGAREPQATSDLWWKNAVVYCLDVETFLDGDGDGCGDLTGPVGAHRLPRRASASSCVWLMPFYPVAASATTATTSPTSTASTRGSARSATSSSSCARRATAGIRVIADLVRQPHLRPAPVVPGGARPAATRPYRDFYVWADEKPEEKPGDVVFPDQEESNWAYDEQAGQWYLHRFYSHQPDLNVANPAVRDEIAQVAGFWLEQGLSGFRVDAVPFLLEPMGMPEGALVDPHELLRDLRALPRRAAAARRSCSARSTCRRAEQRAFFGDEDGDELRPGVRLHRQPGASTWRSPARTPRRSRAALAALPADARRLPVGALRAQPRRAHARQAHRRRARGGVRRLRPRPGHAALRPRPAPAAADDARRRRSAGSGWSTRCCSRCPARRCCSTARRSAWPRTWRSRAATACARRCSGRTSRHGGFTTARRAGAGRSSTEGRSAPRTVNVARQRRDPGSLLNWMERLIRRRRECPELGWGDVGAARRRSDPPVFAHRGDWDGSTVVAVHNLARPRHARRVARASTREGELVDLFGADEPAPRRRARASRSSPTTTAGSACAGPGSGSRPERQPWCAAQYASRAALSRSSGRSPVPGGSSRPARRRRPRCSPPPGARRGRRGAHQPLGVAPRDLAPGGDDLEQRDVVDGRRAGRWRRSSGRSGARSRRRAARSRG